jgi:RimJ/RimL family protein N-acetyltransferase
VIAGGPESSTAGGVAGCVDQMQTARMTGERLGMEHRAEFTTLMCDPAVSPTLYPHRPPPTETEVRDLLVSKERHWARHGFGMWLLRDRDTGAMVGRGGLQYTDVTGRDEVEVGWAIMPDRWGQGLATELARFSVRTAFDVLGVAELIAYSLESNLASRRVMEKSGFSYDRDLTHVGLPHVLHRRLRSDGA